MKGTILGQHYATKRKGSILTHMLETVLNLGSNSELEQGLLGDGSNDWWEVASMPMDDIWGLEYFWPGGMRS